MYSTSRLNIRPVQEKDFIKLLSIYNNPNNMRYIGTGKYDWTLEELKTKWNKIAYDEKIKIGFQVVTLKASDKVIGECGFLKTDHPKQELEIGYLIDEQHRGKGLGFETCRGLLPIAFEEKGLQKVNARMQRENAASAKLLNKFNFKRVKEGKTKTGVEFEDYELSSSDYFEKVTIEDYFFQETDRLILRRLTENDIVEWLDFFENNDSLRFMGLDLTKDKDHQANSWVMTQLERYIDLALGHLGIIEKSTNQFIGMSGIIPRQVDGQGYMEIAYSLKPTFWGKGYGTEAARQLKKYGFENRLSNQFISIIDKENTASIHVAKKNDMKVLFETRYLGMDVFVFGAKRTD